MSVLISKPVVAECLRRLRQRRTHEHFPGYLCLTRLAARSGGRLQLRPDFASFFDEFFRVSGRPEGKPYLKPFIRTAATSENLWMNQNVAGSYAPSSIRNTFKKVVQVEGQGYSLRDDHASMALTHLLLEERINALELAVVLYREYPILGDDPTPESLVSVFANEFGYVSESGHFTPDFDLLYSRDVSEVFSAEWREIHA